MKKVIIPILGLASLLMMSFTVKQDDVKTTYSELDLLSKIESDVLGATNTQAFTEASKKITFTTYTKLLNSISTEKVIDKQTTTSVVSEPDTETTIEGVIRLIEKYN